MTRPDARTMSSASPWTGAEPPPPPGCRQLRAFVLAAPADRAHLERFQQHLAPLRQEGLISLAHRGDLLAGTNTDATMRRGIEEADLVLLLVSADFLACNHTETAQALARHGTDDARVVPVLVRSCD